MNGRVATRRLAPIVFSALVAIASCGKDEGALVDPPLVAFLSRARAANHAADLAENAGDAQKALTLLERLVEGPVPGGASPPPEALEVLADARARLGELRSAAGDFEGALREIEIGLAPLSGPTHFRGHLVEVRGLVLERKSKALAEAGDAPGAERARVAAIASFEEVMEIQAEVIRRALADAAPP